MTFHFRLPWLAPKPVVHTIPRFHAATKAEQRKADDLAKRRRNELLALTTGLSEDDAAAAIHRAIAMPLTDSQRGRA